MTTLAACAIALGFEPADINLDGTVCAMRRPGLIGSDVVGDNTSNAQP